MHKDRSADPGISGTRRRAQVRTRMPLLRRPGFAQALDIQNIAASPQTKGHAVRSQEQLSSSQRCTTRRTAGASLEVVLG